MRHRTCQREAVTILRAVILAGGLVGALDLCYAVAFYGSEGIPPIRIPQSIASGVLGASAFKAGVAAAGFGVALHFLIALCIAAVYAVASRRFLFLTRYPVQCGVGYGAAVYAVMHIIVLPLSAAPKFKTTATSVLSDLAVHMVLIGVPIAFIARRFVCAARERNTAY